MKRFRPSENLDHTLDASKELTNRPRLGGVYTQFDAELGWVTIPNLYLENLFGPEISFRSNSQGFRNDEYFSPEIPRDKFRIVCSGDSFTMGFGVSNDQTFCQLLARMDHRIQAVNMGVVAYGIDQAYLLYRREDSKLNLNLHILAFINEDFNRMASTSFAGYKKPVLAVENNALTVKNVPVPRNNTVAPLDGVDRPPKLGELRTIKFLRHIFHASPASRGREDLTKEEKALPVALKVFQTLRDMHTQENQMFVAVYLPTFDDCLGEAENDVQLRQVLDAETRKMGLWYWDLTGDCQQLPSVTVQHMFFGPNQIAAWHLTAEGNRVIAELLYRRMSETPAITTGLESAAAGRTAKARRINTNPVNP